MQYLYSKFTHTLQKLRTSSVCDLWSLNSPAIAAFSMIKNSTLRMRCCFFIYNSNSNVTSVAVPFL